MKQVNEMILIHPIINNQKFSNNQELDNNNKKMDISYAKRNIHSIQSRSEETSGFELDLSSISSKCLESME